jgi:hypothetical protein
LVIKFYHYSAGFRVGRDFFHKTNYLLYHNFGIYAAFRDGELKGKQEEKKEGIMETQFKEHGIF